MASGSKTIKITNYNNLVFRWEETSQSIANNTTDVSWRMYMTAGASGAISSSAKKPWRVTVNGKTYSGSVSHGISNNSTKTLASGSTTIAHNTDGTKTFSYSFFMTFEGLVFGGESIGNKSGSGTGTLTPIPRQATITSATDFTDEDNPSIIYSNPAGEEVVESLQACISFTGSEDDIAYRNISKTGTTYTFELTEEERTILRNATATEKSKKVYFYIKTVIGGITYYSYLPKTLTIINATPTIAPTAVDVGNISKTLTGDASGTIINGYNTIEVNANATALKGASIVSYLIKCGSKSITTASGKLNGVDSSTIEFSVTDSRGYITKQTLSRKFIEYFKPTCNLEATAPTTEGELTFTVKGVFFNATFGAQNNELTLQYRIKQGNGDYSEWITLTPTIKDNEYNNTTVLAGLDYRSAYTLQARAIDKIYNGTSEEAIVSAEIKVKTIPVYDWSEDDFNFNVPVNINGGLSINHEPLAAVALTGNYNDLINKPETNGFSYSEEEQPTNKYWIDGKPIYIKVLQFTVSTLNSPIVGANIPNFNYLISLSGNAYRPETGKYLPVNFTYSTINFNSCHISSSGDVIVNTSQLCDITAIVEYTKTND
jgi:hypothetical protein